MHYVMNSLMNRAWDQGVIPALLAMNAVGSKHQDTYCKVAGLELLEHRDVVAELDFMMFAGGRLLAGEAKTSGHIDQSDLRAAELAAIVGVEEFFFCTISTFATESRRGINDLRRRLRARNRPMKVSVMTGDDLLDSA